MNQDHTSYSDIATPETDEILWRDCAIILKTIRDADTTPCWTARVKHHTIKTTFEEYERVRREPDIQRRRVYLHSLRAYLFDAGRTVERLRHGRAVAPIGGMVYADTRQFASQEGLGADSPELDPKGEPPRLAIQLVDFLVPKEHRDATHAVLIEEFDAMEKKHGAKFARLKFWKDTLKEIGPYVQRFGMLILKALGIGTLAELWRHLSHH